MGTVRKRNVPREERKDRHREGFLPTQDDRLQEEGGDNQGGKSQEGI